MKNVEDVEQHVRRAPARAHGDLECVEVAGPLTVRYDDFTVDHEMIGRQVSQRCGQRVHPVGPVVPVACQQHRLATDEMPLYAVTVELDLVDPSRTGRHVFAQCRELRLHEARERPRLGTWQHARAETRRRSMGGFALSHDTRKAAANAALPFWPLGRWLGRPGRGRFHRLILFRLRITNWLGYGLGRLFDGGRRLRRSTGLDHREKRHPSASARRCQMYDLSHVRYPTYLLPPLPF